MTIALIILASVLLIIQCYYSLVFFLPFLSFLKQQNAANEIGASPFVSIVVAAHNELQNLKRLLPALLAQEYSNYEVIIGLDRCTDGSAEWLKTIQSSKLRLFEQHFVKGNMHPKKQIIESAVNVASGEIILLTDADCLPVSDQWVSRIASEFDKDVEIVIGYSPYRIVPGFLNKLIQYETIHTAMQYFSFALRKKGYMAVGRNWAYKRDRFLQTGFGETSEYTGGDDDLLFQRMRKAGNYRVCVHQDAFVVSEPPFDWKHWFRQKKRHLSVGRKYKMSVRWDLAMYTGSWLLYLPAILVLGYYNYVLTIIFFMVRILVFATIFRLIAIRLKSKLYWFSWVLLDIFYNLCYFILALSVLLSKKIQWK